MAGGGSELPPRLGHTQRRIVAVWRMVGWPLVGLVALTAVVLGFTGYRIYFERHGVSKSTTDIAYQSVQLFVFETDEVPQADAPWQLELARFLAPAVTGVALVATAAVVFRKELEEVRLRRRRGHVVVCGLGERGARLAKRLVAAGYDVVAVERDDEAPSAAELGRAHVLVVGGDARHADVLRRAGVPRASYVVAVTGTDDVNAEVVIRSGELVVTRSGAPLTCLADIRDPDLCALLRSEELAGAGRRGYRLDFFNVYEQGARLMLRDHPPFGDDGADTPHMVVIGLSGLGRRAIVEAARLWAPRASTASRLVVTAVDPDAERVIDVLVARNPELVDVAVLRPVAAEVTPVRCGWMRGATGAGPSSIYVCVDEDSVALEAALQVSHCPSIGPAPVVVQVNEAAGLATLLNEHGGLGRPHAFNLLDRTFGAELLLGGTYEILARAIHDAYRAQRFREGAEPDGDLSLAPWEDLSEPLRESNRSQATHIGVKLAAIGCGIVPQSDVDAHATVLSTREVELLAQMEHERWVEHREREGWKPGARDSAVRTSPYLVPWDSLSEDVRELDRRAVRAIPGLLESAGYQVVRVTEAGRDRSGSWQPA